MSRQLAPHNAKEHEPGNFLDEAGQAGPHQRSRRYTHRAGLLTSGCKRSLSGLPA